MRKRRRRRRHTRRRYALRLRAPQVTLAGKGTGSQPTSFGAAVEAAFLGLFTGEHDAPRVLHSLRRLECEGFEKHWPGLGLQKADSYMEGLSAEPFPDPHSGRYPWLEAVEASANVVVEEFVRVALGAGQQQLQERGSNVWVPAVRDDALAYGPDWRTLVLQDRGAWDKANSALFPRTTKLLKDLDAPTLEVFFACQNGGTGIASHTDFVNFIQTSHLGLVVPQGDIWMRVGEHTKPWGEGKVIVCDTSFMHETWNGTAEPRYVLILRHWHPEVTPLERIAAQFLFDCSDLGLRIARKLAAKRLRAAALAPTQTALLVASKERC